MARLSESVRPCSAHTARVYFSRGREVVMNAEAQTIRVESTVVESTVETPRRVPVQGLSRLTTYIRGKEILILGPGKRREDEVCPILAMGGPGSGRQTRDDLRGYPVPGFCR